MMRYGFLASVVLFFSMNGCVMADTDTQTCTPLVMKSENKEIVLPGPDEAHTSKLYIFKNTGEKSIWLDHPVLHPSVSAGWSSYLRTGNASALWVNRKNFNLSCAVIHPGKLEYLDCAKVVSVCAPKEVVYQTSRKGTFWLAEDSPWDDLMKMLTKRGVVIKVM
ncbi:MAG TPA: hypothetical protein VLJ15_02165 [Gammaproteobacteria bacterium]|nr:hypothetical protein [Gammaproteobacteria bacterium]